MMGSRSRAVLLLAATFVIGMLLGGAAVAYAGGERCRLMGSAHGPAPFVDRLTREVHLDRVQQDSVRAILGRHQPAIDSLWRDMGPRFETLKQTIRSEIRQQLTPEQQARFTEMMKRIDAKRSVSVPPNVR